MVALQRLSALTSHSVVRMQALKAEWSHTPKALKVRPCALAVQERGADVAAMVLQSS